MNRQQMILFQGIGVVLLSLVSFFLYERLGWAMFVTGLLGGVALLYLDVHYLSPRYQDKTIPSSGQYLTRSLLFMLAYVVTSIFVVTSTNGWLGIGMSLGVGLVLWSELLFTYVSPAQLNTMLGVKKPLKKTELDLLVGGFSFLYIVMVLIILSR